MVPFVVVDGLSVLIGGKHDGITNDGELIEVKTRQHWFLGVPIYEKVQLHAYMSIFDKKKATLVESFDGQQRTHEVHFDECFWDDVKMRVEDFVREMKLLSKEHGVGGGAA
jgi:hypothetical protein